MNASMNAQQARSEPLTTYQKSVLAILAFLQFTVMVDFMILSPLGAILLDELDIDTKQFGLLVSAYAVSAGASSFASAAYVDRFDRKKLLLVLYTGFIGGTALCGFAGSYELLLAARIITGMFGGVIASLTMAIVADVFPLTMRGRAVGAMMTSFSAAQVAGLPAGLALSNLIGWHAPFLVIAAIGALAGVGMAVVLKPLDAHLKAPAKQGVFAHVATTISKPNHLRVFATTVLLSSGFMLMPLLSAFFVNNLHVDIDLLPFVFMVAGLVTLVAGPLVGKLADRVGKLALFSIGSLIVSVVYVAYANLAGAGATALWVVLVANGVMFAANTMRMIPAGALTSAVPAMQDRGAFMSINAALQQVTGGVASFVGGAIVIVQADGTLARFDTLCYVVVALVVVTMVPMLLIDRQVRAQAQAQAQAQQR